MTHQPKGPEREVRFLGGTTLDGAPVAYIIVLAAVVTALSFIPFSVVLALGGSFPLSQGIFPLVGWILGPVAGAVASGIGRLIGVFLAPHTTSVPFVSVISAVVGSFTAGVMAGRRKHWWPWLSALLVIAYLLFAGRAVVQNGVGPLNAILATFLDWSALLLFLLPTRTLFAHWIQSKNLARVALGLFTGTWMITGLSHLVAGTITYFMFNWPEEVWISLIPIIPVENLFRCIVGTVIGVGVIAGLRAIGVVKPAEAIY